MECYGRRSNLLFYGLLGNSKEHIQFRVVKVCLAVKPSFNTRVVDVNSDNQQAKPVSVLLNFYVLREIFSKGQPKKEYLKSNKLQFKEDLIPADREIS